MTSECYINGMQYKCRTCFDPGTTVFLLAEECSSSKTWRDLLTDIVKLNTNDDELLPKTICSKCLEKLISCYDFIIHVRNVNEKYHQLLASGKHSPENDSLASSSKNTAEFLAVSSTALPMGQCVPDIKFEDELLIPYDIVLNNNNRRNDAVKEETCDPFMETLEEDIEVALDMLQYHQRSQNEENRVLEDDINDYNSDNSSTCADESDYLNGKRKIRKIKLNKNGSSSSSSASEHHLPTSQPFEKKTEEQFSKYFPIEKVNNHLVCGVCKKLFSSPTTCRRHIITRHYQGKSYICAFCDQHAQCKNYLIGHLKRKHPDESFESNAKQLGRMFGERLYSKPLLLPRIECKLCCTTFVTKKKLIQHLESHSEVSTLDSLQLSSDIIKRWFPYKRNLQVIKTMICKDIREKNWIKYYTILNDFSYEISISDTDAEDLEKETEAPASKYKCELCAKNFLHKYQVFAHLREDHLNEDIPWKCSHCNLEFISIKMYEQHKQTHCLSKHKILLCPNCNGKFVWHKNIKKHKCVTKILDIEKPLNVKINESYNDEVCSSPKTIIRCGLCDMTFEKLRDLRQHMPLHADGKTGVDFNGCIYVNQFETSSSNRELLEQKIKNAFTKRQISQLYQAIDKYGKEMDISDSDSDEDEKSYLCELCNETFKKRKLLLKHQSEQHRDILMPFTCKECKMQYVSIDLLQQHMKRECWNEHRRVAKQCDCCKERFIWPDNLLRHREMQRYINIENSQTDNVCRTQAQKTIIASSISNSDVTSANIQICYCFLCPKTFANNDQFNDHFIRHRLASSAIKIVASTIHSVWWPNGRKIIKCKICDQVFLRKAELNEHFSSKNSKNLCGGRQHSVANYSITNQMGFELHLELDSETETESIENEENEQTLSYKCCMCSKSFKRKYQIIQHQTSMHNYKLLELKCERCFFRTVSQKVLDYHKVSQCFNVEKMYQCDQCNFKFMWQENLEKHISIFHTSDVFVKALHAANITSNTNAQCLESKEASQNDLSSALHQNDSDAMDGIQSKDKCKCLICGIYITKNNYSEHIRRHECDKSYKCDFCEMVFITNSSLKKHQDMHTGERPFKCTLCRKSFKLQKGLDVHKRLHTEKLPYKCTICSKSFLRSAHLTAHMRCHSGSKLTLDKKSDSTDATQNAQGNRKTNLCPICGVYLSYKTSLSLHIRSHTDEKPFKCDLCDKRFNRSTDLNLHRRTHFTERPFKCTTCEKSFVHRGKLKTHMRIHTGERPYQCTICQKKFTSSGTLKEHSLDHTGKKPFICEICNRAFKCSWYLKKHRVRSGHHIDNN